MKKKTIKLDAEYIMTAQENEDYNNLPDNLPDNKLTKKQIEFVWALYYKYITKNIDNSYGWGFSMAEREQKEKWPSGARVKRHEAQRFILSHLVECNIYRKELTEKKATVKFFYALTCRPVYAEFLQRVYTSSMYEYSRS